MKYLFSVVLISLLLTACNDETSSTNGQHVEPGSDVVTHPDGTVHVKASDIAPFIGLWNYSLGMSSDLDRKQDYVGRWIEFAKDQSFKSGRWQKQLNTGRFSYDAKTQILSLDFKDNSEDRDIDWGIKLDNNVMIWLGNANDNNNGDQIRMQRVAERPTQPVGQ